MPVSFTVLRKKIGLALLLLLSTNMLSFSAYAITNSPTTVSIHFSGYNPFEIHYLKPVRTSQVVVDALNKLNLSTLDIYWSTSGLYKNSSRCSLKNEALFRIANEQDFSSFAQKPYWNALRNHIHSMKFGCKLKTSIDPDLTLIDPSKNPLIRGLWKLDLQTQANNVFVIGAVNHIGNQPWAQRQDAKYYAKIAGMLNPQQSKLTVIQPDGVVQSHSVAYWNKHFQEVAPGAIVYVPMHNAHTWLEINKPKTNTNDVIVELLRNKQP